MREFFLAFVVSIVVVILFGITTWCVLTPEGREVVSDVNSKINSTTDIFLE